MKTLLIAAATIAALGLGACKKADRAEIDGQGQHGRYLGVGIYQPQESWTKIVAAQQTKDAPEAQVIDDQAILVMVDSTTGELRACGDLSGYCIGMNPWEKPLSPSQRVPIKLTGHGKPSQVMDDAAAASNSANPRP